MRDTKEKWLVVKASLDRSSCSKQSAVFCYQPTLNLILSNKKGFFCPKREIEERSNRANELDTENKKVNILDGSPGLHYGYARRLMF